MLKSTYSGSPALSTKDGAFDVLQRLLNEGVAIEILNTPNGLSARVSCEEKSLIQNEIVGDLNDMVNSLAYRIADERFSESFTAWYISVMPKTQWEHVQSYTKGGAINGESVIDNSKWRPDCKKGGRNPLMG
jgi:hypothetical protein